MTTPLTPASRLRDDLTVVEIDGDLVVFDPVRMQSHVLTGGAVVVWAELENQPIEGVGDRVAGRMGCESDDISSEVDAVLLQIDELGLLTATAQRHEKGRTEG